MSARSRKEHRANTRPHSGDLRVCPFCRAGSIVFSEAYDVDGIASPAWVCENPSCGYRVLVRRTMKRPAHLTAAAVGRHTKSKS